jgi:hypothetical protein
VAVTLTRGVAVRVEMMRPGVDVGVFGTVAVGVAVGPALVPVTSKVIDAASGLDSEFAGWDTVIVCFPGVADEGIVTKTAELPQSVPKPAY